jgi:4-aminobutyrate aminotransferase-like enzyme
MSTPTSEHAQQLLELKSRYLMPCVYHFYRAPMVLERAQACTVYDSEGKAYLDCYSGVGVSSCGHNNPAIVEAAERQLKKLVHTTTIYLTEPMLYLAKELAEFISGTMTRSFFCTSGSEANEGALLLAKLATGRNDFIALGRSLHGRTAQTMAATGMAFWCADPEPPDNVHFASSPTCSDCPLSLKFPECQLKCADSITDILDSHPGEIAALIAEPIQGNGGIVVPPPGYFEKVQAILREQGVLLIMDEAQTGFCRTGKRFGHQNWDIQPDIMSVCKALANGLPIAAFVATDEVAKKYNKPGASTFGGNLVCAEAARATLKFMSERGLDESAERAGKLLRLELELLSQIYPIIADIRGLGLMLGMELINEDGEPASAQMDELLEVLKDDGVLVGKTGPGRNVLTLMPPLVISDLEIKQLVASLKLAFERVCAPDLVAG